MIFYICLIILVVIIGVLIGVEIYTKNLDTRIVGQIIVNLDDVDTNNIKIHWTNPRNLFNTHGNVVFNVKYVHEGINTNREKK